MGAIMVSELMKNPRVSVAAARELLGPEHGRSLPVETLQMLSGALDAGLSINFWIICAAAVGAFVAGLFFPRVSRGSNSSAPPAEAAAPH
ncbi:MAG TPA: hypothetical protein VF815_45325 [Myxococcaceae bacterium]|jgi:hypothetical protein